MSRVKFVQAASVKKQNEQHQVVKEHRQKKEAVADARQLFALRLNPSLEMTISLFLNYERK